MSKGKSNKSSKGKSVLSDHQRIGRRFIPPMLQVGNVEGISISQRIIPEFLWMAILNDDYGWKGGAELSLFLARAAAQATGISPSEFEKSFGQAPKELFATTTAYGTLTEEQKSQLIRSLKLSFKWESLVKALAPLVAYYPKCPLSFLFEGALVSGTKEDLEHLKAVLKELYDKYTKQAVSMFSNAVYIAFCTNKMRALQGTGFDNFPSIQNYPDTEESRAIAAGVRATVYTLIGDTPPDWVNYFWNATDVIVQNYVQEVNDELSERWKAWSLDLSQREMYEVIGALLARQVTLAAQLAISPSIWNEHVAPLILRSMVDNYINLAWIFCDSLDRARKFIQYGLGQEKLQVEHLKARLSAENQDANEYPEVKYREDWINAQQYTFLTEVNIGSWSGIDTRTMADQAGCLEFYNRAYQPFTSATHNMWNHVGKYNLVICPNPLHRYHAMPTVRSLPPDINFVLEAAFYVEKAFALFDEKTSSTVNTPSAYQKFMQGLDQLGNSLPKVPKADEG